MTAASPKHSVFLSYNRVDQPAVEAIAERLRQEGLELWLDIWNLIPGQPWQPDIERAFAQSYACLLFIGPSGIGPWQHEEMRVAIDQRVNNREFRLIPVLLPGAARGERSAVPPFLANVTWIEFRRSLDEKDAFYRLLCGIRGLPPGARVMPGESTEVCPYRGLEAFDVADSRYFFGREALVEWLISDLRRMPGTDRQNRFLTIVGASGSGKSSLARAGLLAQLRQGAIEGSAAWPQVIFKAGEKPLESLALAVAETLGLAQDRRAVQEFVDDLARDPRTLHLQTGLSLRTRPESRLVILIDQLEEIFTLCRNETVRQAFIANLLYAATIVGGQAIVVLTLRADFLGKCADYSELAAALSDHQVLVGPMTDDEIRLAIERPALLAGGEFESGLVDSLLADVKAQPGALPLLQHALFELWQRREGQRLTHRAYEAIGRVEGALAKRADDIYGAFSEAEKAIARHVLLRLTQPGEGTEDTRRRATLKEMITSSAEASSIEKVIKSLVDFRLVVTEGSMVEVAHEALIRGWPQLRQWIDEDRGALLVHRRLTEAAEEWQRLERDESALYQGLRLDLALAWRKGHEEDLNEGERDFLDASLDLRQRQEAEQRRMAEEKEAQRRRELRQQRLIAQLSVAGLLVALLLALAAGYQWKTAAEQRRVALSEKLAIAAKEAANDNKFDLALLLGAEANELGHFPEAKGALLTLLLKRNGFMGFLQGHADAVWGLAFSPDGRTLASASRDHTVRLWDTATRRPLGAPLTGHENIVWDVAYSPDGKIVASAGKDGTIRLWDVATQKPLGEPLRGHEDWVESIAFSPDGKTLASASKDKTIRLWEVATSRPLGEPLRGHEEGVTSVAFRPDGKTLASASEDSTLRLWDVATRQPSGEPLRGHDGEVLTLAFSPDGKTLASGGMDRGIRLWDVTTRQPLGMPLNGHQNTIWGLTFSPDGARLASASEDKTIRLWDMATHQPWGGPLSAHQNWVWAIAFSPDGRTLASGGRNGKIWLWDVNTARPRGEPLSGYQDVAWGMAYSPDGKTLALGGEDGTIRLWDLATRQPLGEPLTGHQGAIWSITFSPDGRTLASGGEDRTIRLWNVATQQLLGAPLVGHQDDVTSIAFSPDGGILASGSEDGTLRLWDIQTRQPLGEPLTGHQDAVWSIAFSPDGKMLASGSVDQTLRLWDVATRQPLGAPLTGHEGRIASVAFSPDGKILASGGEDRVVRLWEVATRQPLGEPLMAHQDTIWRVAFSPDGKTLVSGSEDKTIQLWDVATRQPLGEALMDHEGSVLAVTFSPDGKMLASGSKDKTVRLWDIERLQPLEEPLQLACALAGRNLTLAEWHYYIGDEKYRKTCPEWPEPPNSNAGL